MEEEFGRKSMELNIVTRKCSRLCNYCLLYTSEHQVKRNQSKKQINVVNNKLDQQEIEKIKLILQRHQLLNEAMEDKLGKIIGVQYK